MRTSEAFATQAEHCAALGSPFMARLMTLFAARLDATDGKVAERLLSWSGDPSHLTDSVPLRTAGALHALRLERLALTEVYPPNEVSDDDLWRAVTQSMEDHADRVLQWLENAPQTNEVRRMSAILPALAVAHAEYGRPVDLIELGTSGGLNLRCDRFRLDANDWSLGPHDARVRLAPTWTGEVPPLALPDVIRRRGVDLSPIDPLTKTGHLRLLAYLWPDQPDRLSRTEAAIEEARNIPAEVSQGDAGDWLATALSQPDPRTLMVVFHTIAWQYFPKQTAAACEAAMTDAARHAPLVRLSMEGDGGDGAAIALTEYPGGEPRLLGRADFHGRWIDWRA